LFWLTLQHFTAKELEIKTLRSLQIYRGRFPSGCVRRIELKSGINYQVAPVTVTSFPKGLGIFDGSNLIALVQNLTIADALISLKGFLRWFS
jgi:hypothetical protein